MTQIKEYTNKGIAHIPLALAKETLEQRDHGVFEEVNDMHFKLYGEWHFDALEALMVLELSKLNTDFVIVPAPPERITHMLEGDQGNYVSKGKGGRVWIDCDNDFIWSIVHLVSLHKFIVDSIGDDAIGLETTDDDI